MKVLIPGGLLRIFPWQLSPRWRVRTSAIARRGHERIAVVQVSLERAGFVAESSEEAVEKWLEERFLGPEVHERTWSAFGAALSSRRGPIVLFNTLFWDILHPQGWVRAGAQLVVACESVLHDKPRKRGVADCARRSRQLTDNQVS